MNALFGVGIGVGVIAFAAGVLVGLVSHRRPDAAQQRLAEIEHAELMRLRRQRRAALHLADQGQAGQFGMFGLVPITELREALGIPRPPVAEFGRGNTRGPDPDPPTDVIGS